MLPGLTNLYALCTIGNWNQEEYQTLFNLVNLDLKLKAFTEEPETHAMVSALFSTLFELLFCVNALVHMDMNLCFYARARACIH